MNERAAIRGVGRGAAGEPVAIQGALLSLINLESVDACNLGDPSCSETRPSPGRQP